MLESLEDSLKKDGPKFALSRVKDLLETNDQVASSCHPLTHMLGRASFEFYGFQQAFGDDLIGTDDASLLRICNAAFMHGIIEHYLRDSDNNLLENVNMVNESICKRLNNVELGTWECRHGIGHGVLQYYRAQAKLQELQGALQECRNTQFVSDCENGLWMDHFASTNVGQDLEPSSLQVCYTFATTSSSGICSLYSPTEFLLHHPRAYKDAIAFCSEGLEDHAPLLHNCIKGVGMQAAKENLNDYRPVGVACQSAPTERDQTACFREALSYYHMTTGLAKVPKSVCEPLTIYKDLCQKFSD